MWELFCPVHGIPALFGMIAPMWGVVAVEAQMLYFRIVTLFGRYL